MGSCITDGQLNHGGLRIVTLPLWGNQSNSPNFPDLIWCEFGLLGGSRLNERAFHPTNCISSLGSVTVVEYPGVYLGCKGHLTNDEQLPNNEPSQTRQRGK
jgi:hypothetical protein